jgi:hypothetical protein
LRRRCIQLAGTTRWRCILRFSVRDAGTLGTLSASPISPIFIALPGGRRVCGVLAGLRTTHPAPWPLCFDTAGEVTRDRRGGNQQSRASQMRKWAGSYGRRYTSIYACMSGRPTPNLRDWVSTRDTDDGALRPFQHSTSCLHIIYSLKAGRWCMQCHGCSARADMFRMYTVHGPLDGLDKVAGGIDCRSQARPRRTV